MQAIQENLEFSVIIPAKNSEKTIGRVIKCALNQEYPKGKYEIIVVDNDSSDGTAATIKKFPVKYLFNKKPGAAATRNFGVKNAKGGIIAFIDSDRFAEKNWLREADKFFKENKNANIAAGKIALDKYSFIKKVMLMGKMDQKFFIENGFAATCNFFIRKKTFEKLGGFDERLFITSEDVEFGERATALEERIFLLENAIVKYNPRPFFRFLKNEFRRGRAAAHLKLLREKGLEYNFPRTHKIFNLLKRFLPGKEHGLLDTALFLLINGSGKIVCYCGQAYENACLSIDKNKKQKLLSGS